MSELTAKAKMMINKTVLEPQVILEIEGLPLFSVTEVWKIPRFDDPGLNFDDPDFRFDDVMADKTAHQLIDLTQSTQVITQQLFQDKGIAGSVTTMTISLVDKAGLLTKIISPGLVVDDILSRRAIVYMNFGKGAHPEDSIPILFGVVDTIDAGNLDIKLKVSHPEGLKRQDIFTKIQAALASRLRYRSKQINGVDYQTQDAVVGNVTVSIVSGGTKGSETVTVVGNAITISANTTASNPADRSTASGIVSAIKKSQAAVNLVSVSTVENQDATPQAAFGATTLDSSTTITLDVVDGMLLPSEDGTFRTYVRIEDEIIQYTGITDTTLTGLTRGCFGTIPRTYEIGDDCETYYRINGSMKDLALKMMLSRGRPIQNIPAYSVLYIDAETQVPNSIIFSNVDIRKKYGVTVGDFIKSEASAVAANNFAWRKITGLEINELGSHVLVDGAPLEVEQTTQAMISFKSKYDVWPDGLAMQLDQVDVEKHEELVDLFPSTFFDYDFYLEDTIKGDQFIESQIYRPSCCFGLPRAGRASLGMTMPPLAQENTLTLDENNIIDPDKIRIQRSYNENFYNSVIYKYEKDAIEDKLTRGVPVLSAASFDRVKNVRNLPMVIEAQGVRDSADTREKIQINSKRLLDRYQFGAEKIAEVEILYKDSLQIEVGNTVIFGSDALRVSDSTNGTRRFRPRVMEVVNIRKNVYQCRAYVTLLNTAYEADGKFGVISPASLIGPGATTSRLPLVQSFGTEPLWQENYKWKNYVGQKVLIRTEDWSQTYDTTFRGFDQTNPNLMIVNPALPVAPGEDWVVETPPYPDESPEDGALWKSMHVFFDPQVEVVASAALNQIEVSPDDIDKFRVGCPVEIHNDDYTLWTGDTTITVKEITGNVLTLSRSVDFSVSPGHMIELIGFRDGGAPYRML
nr:hypothetical protein CKG001_10280 [Bdellovibrio sp. CKG001]